MWNRRNLIFIAALSLICACTAISPGVSAGEERNRVTLQIDVAGARAIVEALERDSLSEAEIDDLLRVHGVQATVENVTRFIPNIGVPQFRTEVRTFARSKKGGEYGTFFQFNDVWRERSRILGLAARIRGDQARIVTEALALLEPYRPDSGDLSINVYLVAGGVSDGFAFEHDLESFYLNLARAGGDQHEVMANLLHEAYHVMQMAAQKRAGTFLAWITDESIAPVDRLFMGTLMEGTAALVADPARLTAGSGSLHAIRERYGRAAREETIAENFATFDRVLEQLQSGTLAWRQASEIGFSRSKQDEERFYFVGYQMARTIERYCGQECIGQLFALPAVEFFRQYIAIYRGHPEIRWRFSPETEKAIEMHGSLQTGLGDRPSNLDPSPWWTGRQAFESPPEPALQTP